MQNGVIFINDEMFKIDVPDPDKMVMPGLPWGLINTIGTPANWLYLVKSRRLTNEPIRSRLGDTLLEEVGACLLGGYGIPAQVGLAAYWYLKSKGAFTSKLIDEDMLLKWLSEPLLINNRPVKYRFARQKARYLAAAIDFISNNTMQTFSGKALRARLLEIPGIGLKTASWVSRNWLNANDVAILDIHILRAGIIGGFMDGKLRVEKDYLKLEEQFLNFSNALDIPASELDAEIWWQFSRSPTIIHSIFNKVDFMPGRQKLFKKPRPQHSHSNTTQTSLLI